MEKGGIEFSITFNNQGKILYNMATFSYFAKYITTNILFKYLSIYLHLKQFHYDFERSASIINIPLGAPIRGGGKTSLVNYIIKKNKPLDSFIEDCKQQTKTLPIYDICRVNGYICTTASDISKGQWDCSNKMILYQGCSRIFFNKM